MKMSDPGNEQFHIDSFVQAFIVPKKKERFLLLLSNPKKRSKITKSLINDSNFIIEKMLSINSSQGYDSILNQCLSYCESKCYVISEDSNIDNKILPIAPVLYDIFYHNINAVISLSPGIAAYVQFEGKNNRFFLIDRH